MRAACEARDYATAANLVISQYGGEVLAFLCARLRSDSHGEEVFATFAEKLWIGLPGFEWRCSLKGWAYRLARNAANDFEAAANNRPRHNLALSSQLQLSALIDRARSTTALHRRTPVKDRMRELRETLAQDDQMLLILRVDRGMAWRDLAAAMSAAPAGDDRISDHAELDREAARLRKRFERIKDELRELARAEGLLPES